ncbi:MAG: hypothetical protein P8P20_04240, partial [Acidimicrobiales bacterium]|nr:hypothetical protein [Acidimicrobiales bacterium]
RVNDLVRSIQQGGSLPPGVSTILGAEAVEAWARAAETAGSASPDSVARALASFNNERFTTGPLSFVAGARMDLGRTYRLLSVVDGELSVVGLMETGD